jgi:hypothetical protein
MHLSQIRLIGMLLLVGAVNSGPSSAQDLKEVKAAWSARKDRVRSARVVWRESQFLPKGAAVSPDLASRNESDLEFRNQRTILIEGTKVRSEYHRIGNEKISSVLCFKDGILSGYHDQPFISNKSRPYGSIMKNDRFSQANLPVLLPVFWSLRMDEPTFKTLLSDQATLEARRGNIDGTECLVVTDRKGRGTEEYWIAPSLDFNILRRIYRGGSTTEQTDVSYQRHGELDWYPASWRTSHVIGRRLMGEWRAAVDEYQINPELTDADFDVAFPPGILLYNEVEGKSYITRENGEKRLILPSERGATFQELKATDSGEALIKRKNESPLRLFVLIAAMIALAAGLAIRLRLRGTLYSPA